MKFVNRLVIIENADGDEPTGYALLSDGKITRTNLETNNTEVVAETVCREYCDSLAVTKGGRFACASYENNKIEIRMNSDMGAKSVRVIKPLSIAAYGESFLAASEFRDAFLIHGDEVKAMRLGSVSGVISVEGGASIVITEEDIIFMGEQLNRRMELTEGAVISATLSNCSLAIGSLNGIIAIYDIYDPAPQKIIEFPKDGAAQAIRWVDNQRLNVLWQSFSTSERWIGEIDIHYGGLNLRYKIPFSGGLGTFLRDGCFCQKNGDVYDRKGRKIKTINFTAVS